VRRSGTPGIIGKTGCSRLSAWIWLFSSMLRITQDEYDKKARALKQRQTEIALRIEQHQKGEGDFRTTLESLISLASRAAELFERSKPEQKRQLLAFVFSNLRLRGTKLEFSLRSPFDLMVLVIPFGERPEPVDPHVLHSPTLIAPELRSWPEKAIG
jgi:hypothetical protein